MLNRTLGVIAGLCLFVAATVNAADVVLVEQGISKAPIVLAPDAAPATVRAANDLALYIEKISGAKPQVLTDSPTSVPPSAIWVGVQPGAESLFPEVSLKFEKPEEILIVARGSHVIIAGRDRALGGTQVEFGTANAVYSFIENQLNVRWLWPGSLGEDIVAQPTIAIAPVTYRFAPPFRERRVFKLGHADPWNRFHRNQLDSLTVDAGHAFSQWWEKYHESHPEYFALQPDGTRQAFPAPETAKLCETEPAVWRQWLENADDSLRQNPAQQVIGATPGDSTSNGTCVCERCLAWDHPGSRAWALGWKGHKKQYVALTDRFVKFWNQLGGMLKQRYPDRDLFVGGFAYGPGKPPPMEAMPADNVIVSYVGHFPLASDGVRQREQEEWQQWAAKAKNLHFRPNLFWYDGGHLGMPAVALKNTAEDFRFLAEHHCIGLSFDTTPQHWSTQGVQYYLMAKLAYDPMQDSAAVLTDYLQRGFGSAADDVRRYVDLLEQAHAQITGPQFRHSMGAQVDLIESLPGIYHEAWLKEAEAHLTAAARKAADGPEKFRQRVAFLRTGLDFVRIQVESIQVMATVRESKGNDAASVKRASDLAKARDTIIDSYDGVAINPWMRSYMVNRSLGRGRTMPDYFGPPTEAQLKSAGIQRHFRWIGKASGAFWSTAGNWEHHEAGAWRAADSAPGPGDLIFLGDDCADAPQTIYLDRDISVARVIFSATGARTYRIASREDGAADHLDADSGMIFALRLTDAAPLEMRPAATQALHLQVETTLLHNDSPTWRMASENGARVVIERPLRGSDQLVLDGGGDNSSGIFELRVPLNASRLTLTKHAHLLLNAPGSGDVLSGSIVSHDGVVLVQRSASLRGGVMLFGGTLRVRAHGNGSEPVTLQCADLSRRGKVVIDRPVDGSTGPLTLAVSTIYSSAGKAHAPTIETASDTWLALGGDQESPTHVDLSAGIHGEGGLVKDRGIGRRTRPLSLVGDRNTYRGPTLIRNGGLQLAKTSIPSDSKADSSATAFAGQLGPGMLHLSSQGTFDLNGLSQTVAGLSDLDGGGEVKLAGGSLTIDNAASCAFSGSITGGGTLVKSGVGDLTLASSPYVNPPERTLRVAGGRLLFKKAVIEQGKLEFTGGRIEAQEFLAPRQAWRIALNETLGDAPLVVADAADLTGARLELSVVEGFKPKAGQTFTLLLVRGGLETGGSPLFGLNPGDSLQTGETRWGLALQKDSQGVTTVRLRLIDGR